MIVRSPFKTQWFSDFVVLWISTNSFPVIFSLDQMGYLWGCHESVSRIPLDLRYMTSTIYSTQYTLSTRFVALSKEIKLAWRVIDKFILAATHFLVHFQGLTNSFLIIYSTENWLTYNFFLSSFQKRKKDLKDSL